jgi:hypothetical protein
MLFVAKKKLFCSEEKSLGGKKWDENYEKSTKLISIPKNYKQKFPKECSQGKLIEMMRKLCKKSC